MITVSLTDAKAHLSALIDRVEAGGDPARKGSRTAFAAGKAAQTNRSR